jgi:HEAT repeat protein
MTGMRKIDWLGLGTTTLLACLTASLPAEEPATAPAEPAAVAAPAAPAPNSAKQLPWRDDFAAGLKAAQAAGQPVLVRAGAAWCQWCEKQKIEIADPAVQTELGRWTLVYLDVDAAPAEARRLGIGPIPALRVLNPAGKIVAEQDGMLRHQELAAWLGEQFTAATTGPVESLLATGPPSARDLKQLIAALRSPAAAERETAIRRLLPYPGEAAKAVAADFAEARLSARLSALELLAHWQAPIAEIDPWQPDTVTPARLTALTDWAEARSAAPPAESAAQAAALTLTAAEKSAAAEEIARLTRLGEGEADASIERLARFRAALLPLVYEALKVSPTDEARQRLTQLRLRLVTTDSLALRWPGGIQRLSSADVPTRRAAAAELATKAAADDESLLLELFGDSDSLVRELSLKALRDVAGNESSAALVRLLDDPEPNVRAAVLKQLTETPAPAMAGQISKYVDKEQDADLVVHAIRVLKELKTPQATATLMKLLAHDSWQVRAEAVEALADSLDRNSPGDVEVAVALVERLDDADLFVVSRAIKGLKQISLDSMLKPMAAAAARHPELTAEVVEAMSTSRNLGAKAVPYLREFARDKNPLVRAAAIKGLVATDQDFNDLLIGALSDEASEVRVAAVDALQKQLDLALQQEQYQAENPFDGPEDTEVTPPSPSLFGKVLSLFVPRTTPAAEALGEPTKETDGAGEDESVPAEEPDEEQQVDESGEGEPELEAAEPAMEEAQEEKSSDADRAAEQDTPEEPAADDAEMTDESPAAGSDDDAWLRDYQAGKGRPKWMAKSIEPLEKMLLAADTDERLPAAVALAALGKRDEALGVLETIADREPKRRGELAAALPWLLWPQRKQFFDRLMSPQPAADQLSLIAQAMGRSVDLRSAEPLWTLLGAEHVDDDQTNRVYHSLQNLYQAHRVMSVQGNRRVAPAVLKLWKQFAAAGRPAQQVVAMALMINNEAPAAAAESAERLFATPGISESLRADAFQLQLASLDAPAAEKLAAAQLGAESPAVRKLAARYLTLGFEALQILRKGMYLQSQSRLSSYRSGAAIEVSAPKGVSEEMVRPLLADADAEVAACGGYLLALLGKDDGLERLVGVWRGKSKTGEWHQPLYRAIATLDDDSRTPLLAEIYKTLRDWDRREFYWTIRSMNGPQVLKLRKQIRDDVGMDNLK